MYGLPALSVCPAWAFRAIDRAYLVRGVSIIASVSLPIESGDSDPCVSTGTNCPGRSELVILSKTVLLKQAILDDFLPPKLFDPLFGDCVISVCRSC